MEEQNVEVIEFSKSLSNAGKIYLLSKLAGMTIGCINSDKDANPDLIGGCAFSTISTMCVCSIIEPQVSAMDRMMIDEFITANTEIPDEIMGMVDGMITSLKSVFECETIIETDVMFR